MIVNFSIRYTALVLFALLSPLAVAQFDYSIGQALEDLTPETGQNVEDLLGLGVFNFGRLEGFAALFEALRLNETSYNSDNCTVDDVDLYDQGGPHAIGPSRVVDRLFLHVSSHQIIAVHLDISTHPILEAARNMHTSGGIIVLDNFAEGGIGDELSFELSDEAVNMMVNTANAQTDPQADIRAALMKVSHGALVLEHLKQLIAATDQFREPSLEHNGDTLVLTFPKLGDASIELVVVAQHHGGTTSSAETALEAAKNTLMVDRDIEQFAVNMSFAINPCIILESYRVNREGFDTYQDYLTVLGIALTAAIQAQSIDEDFRAFLAELGQLSNRENVREFLEVDSAPFDRLRQEILTVLMNPIDVAINNRDLCTVTFLSSAVSDDAQTPAENNEAQTRDNGPPRFETQDPLLFALCQDGSDSARSLVASAGNFGGETQVFPAALDEVVGVTASLGADPGKNSFFNDGEILELGGHFDLIANRAHGDRVLLAGSSFSAPIVTLFTALDMVAQPMPKCTYGNPPGLSKDALSTLSLNNRLLNKAVMNDNCTIP